MHGEAAGGELGGCLSVFGPEHCTAQEILLTIVEQAVDHLARDRGAGRLELCQDALVLVRAVEGADDELLGGLLSRSGGGGDGHAALAGQRKERWTRKRGRKDAEIKAVRIR